MATELFKDVWNNIDKIGTDDFGDNMSVHEKNTPEEVMNRLKEVEEDNSLQDLLISLFNHEDKKKQGSND